MHIQNHDHIRRLNCKLAETHGTKAVAAAIGQALKNYKLDCLGDAPVGVLDSIFHQTKSYLGEKANVETQNGVDITV